MTHHQRNRRFRIHRHFHYHQHASSKTLIVHQAPIASPVIQSHRQAVTTPISTTRIFAPSSVQSYSPSVHLRQPVAPATTQADDVGYLATIRICIDDN